MNYHGIETDSMTNGDGLRVVLWVSGCEHHCKGCHNPQTWNKYSGKPFDSSAMLSLYEELDKEYIAGLTISGGDPLHPANRSDVLSIAEDVWRRYHGRKTIWLYTGYSYEEVKYLPIMNYIDVLVDGRFVQGLADVNYPWAGSTNQRVIRLCNGKPKDM